MNDDEQSTSENWKNLRWKFAGDTNDRTPRLFFFSHSNKMALPKLLKKMPKVPKFMKTKEFLFVSGFFAFIMTLVLMRRVKNTRRGGDPGVEKGTGRPSQTHGKK